jgi:hypothetical protein
MPDDEKVVLTRAQHKLRHVMLHSFLDELVADWLMHGGESLVRGSIMDLIVWSNFQTKSPTPANKSALVTHEH